MLRTITRRIFTTGNSRTFALPLDWPGRNDDRVFVVYDDFLLIISEDLAKQIDIQQFTSILRDPLLKEHGHDARPRNPE